MMNKASDKVQPLPRNLKRSFEHAVQDIYAAGLTGKVSQYRTPIVRRATAAHSGSKNEEKRALSDAARALALLWKISPHSSR